MTHLTANWSYPTAMRFGAGRIKELADACLASNMRNPLFVTDQGLASLPVTQSTLALLDEAKMSYGFFSEVVPNPTEQNLADGLKAYHDGNHDGVIAFGGGSGIDMGKLIAFMSGQTRPVWDFEDIGDWWTRADVDGIAPNIAIPTTAGTGTEVGRASVITNSESHVKKIIFHPKILPSVVICDPELTVGMPRFITVGTGMDAFVHCLEAYCSPHYHPMSQGIAIEGMRLVQENLPIVSENPNDLVARAHMMSAAAMGATAFQKGLGGIHALAHPIGAVYNTHHGMTNATLIPEVLKFNRKAIEPRIESLARYLSIENGFNGFMDFIMQMRHNLGVPNKLGDLGIDTDQLALLAEMAVDDPSAGGNPIPLTKADTLKLLEASF